MRNGSLTSGPFVVSGFDIPHISQPFSSRCGTASRDRSTVMRCIAGALAVVCLMSWATTAQAELDRSRFVRVPTWVKPEDVPHAVNSRVIFLNRCAAGCKITFGATDSRTNKSQIGQGTLSAFKYGDDSWNAVVQCMKDTFSRFNVRVTDRDPGATAPHFEIMIAGTPGQIGLSGGVLGIAEYSCQQAGVCTPYLPNTIVYDFSNAYDGIPNRDEEICATAAQEIAHTWTLDHVTDKTDPMTYYTYQGHRDFKDGVMCGSDCVNGQSPFGLTCSGQSHTCMSTGKATQDDVKILLGLFGPSCADDAGCEAGYFCYEHACLAGPQVTGGLGAVCTTDVDCLDGVCANDGNMMACATSCDLNNAATCPAGFGCLDAGKDDGTGVCWAGLDDGGCCDTSGRSNGAGPMLLGLGVLAAFVTRRRKAKA
jgi:hypothetical protein